MGIPISVTDTLSAILGNISLTAWICVLIPQLISNYKTGNAEGLSMAFIVVWLLGDLANFIGALLIHLGPTAIAIGAYFCIADLILMGQCLYYKAVTSDQAKDVKDRSVANEESPLLPPDCYQENEVETSRSQPSSSNGRDTKALSVFDSQWVTNTICLAVVHIAGLGVWFVQHMFGAWDGNKPGASSISDMSKGTSFVVGIGLGYLSAVLYLCARIPQIIKNYREKSCEGLSLLFFLLSLTGNLTYSVSLLAYSQEKSYLLNSIPWLVGSLGTISEDFIIFVQFRMYSRTSIEDVS